MNIDAEAIRQLRAVLRGRECVSGLTHSFYRYPARFSPAFARTAISLFSRPGDTVLDPFVGGGTTVVEALATGRRAIGVDLNSLAAFVTRSRTTPLSDSEVSDVYCWLSLFKTTRRDTTDLCVDFGAQARHVPVRLQALVAHGIEIAATLRPRSRAFIRTVLLSTCQWALDGRERIPTCSQFRTGVQKRALLMLSQLQAFAERLRETGIEPPSRVHRARRVIRGNTAELRREHIPLAWRRPKLVIGSPPYMGIHVLYNRWQVQGRRETPFAYGVSGTPDGYFASHYTFGDRN